MAEFCLKCFVKYVMTDDDNIAGISMSNTKEICEGCGKYLRYVINVKSDAKILNKDTKHKAHAKAENVMDVKQKFECPFVQWKETDYDVFSGHSSYIPVCTSECNKDEQCYAYQRRFCKHRHK